MSQVQKFGRQGERLKTIAETAELLGVSHDFIRREITANRISVYRIRGAIRISNEDLNEYLERHHQVSAESVEPKRSHF